MEPIDLTTTAAEDDTSETLRSAGADSVLERVAATWCSVLNLDAVDPDTNFFDLGGNSFQLLMVKDKLDKALGMRTELVSFFRYPTVADMAGNIYGSHHEQ